jgi:hypothetical protein
VTAWVPTNPTLYRLWRLRRMILFCTLFPIAAVGLLALVTDGAATLAQPHIAAPVLVLWLGLLIAMLLGFPRGLDEALVHSLTLTVLILISPLFELLVAQADGPLRPPEYAVLAFLVCVAWVLVMAAFALPLEKFIPKGPRPMLRWSARLWVDVPPHDVLQALRPSPNRQTALSRTGPRDADGRIPVWILLPPPPPGSQAPADHQTDGPHYWTQVLKETSTSFSEMAVNRTRRTETIHTELFPDNGGTLIVYRSISNTLTLMESVFFWLGDMIADHLQALIDEASNHSPPRALRLLAQDSPVQWLSRTVSSDRPRYF